MGHVPTARLRFSHRKLANLHPAEIADLVEAASHDEGEEIIKAVGQDRELEADVFEELDEHHQLEFIRERPDEQVAAVHLAHGPRRRGRPDRRDRAGAPRAGSSRCCRPPSITRSRALLGYNPETAGGLMSPDFVALADEASRGGGARAGALQRARAGDADDGLPARRAAARCRARWRSSTLLRAEPRTRALARRCRARARVGAAPTPTCRRSRAR